MHERHAVTGQDEMSWNVWLQDGKCCCKGGIGGQARSFFFVYFPAYKTYFHCLLIYVAFHNSLFFTKVISNH